MTNYRRSNYKGSSDHLKEDLNLRKKTNNRIVIFVAVVLFLTTILIARLYSIQIINGDYYQGLVDAKQQMPISTETARGEIYDRNGELMVTNRPINIINFLTPYYMDSEDMWELAMKFAERYEVDFDLMPRELKDLYLFLNDNGANLVSSEELKELNYDSESVDALKLERVTDELISTLSDFEKESFKIYLKMNMQTQGNPSVILDDASDEDIAYLSENLHDFPGFSWGTTWEREYVGHPGLKAIIGSVGDIPAEKLSYMRAKGYASNDKVGVTGLEYQYEEYLSGIKNTVRQNPITGEYETVQEGSKGNNLILSIDTNLQKYIEEYFTEYWKEIRNQPRREHMTGIDYIASDPQTGEILAVVGIRETEDGEVYNSPTSPFLESFLVGSAIKGATIYAGLNQGVIKPNEIIVDQPLHIKGTAPRISYTTLGPVSDLTSLALSSNVYMFEVAIRLAGGKYVPNQELNFTKTPNEAFNLMRNYFGQFGLGVPTQIDFPREDLGYIGTTKNAGLLLDYAIGQFDSYNALHLNQYISTIANGGYRLKPFLVKEIHSPNGDQIVKSNNPVILNELDDKASLKRVQTGLEMCASRGGTCHWQNFEGLEQSAAKTGTAENYLGSKTIINNTYVSYSPAKNAQIATSCIHSGTYYGSSYTSVCRDFTPSVIKYYMKNK